VSKLSISLPLIRIALVAAIVTTSALAVVPLSQAMAQTFNDKLLHGLGFLVLAVLADRSLPRVAFLPWIAAALLAYGVSIELVQSRLPYRSFSWGDIGADAAGLAVYALLAWVLSRSRLAFRRAGPRPAPERD
jgi:VanZ family protein